jgi:hypothetical protein
MNFHAIMPFYRKHLKDDLLKHFEPMNLIWHPVCDNVDMTSFEKNTLSWIKPLLCMPLLPGDMCYRKNNDFINAGDIVDDDYYGFIHDDDMYVPGFINKIKRQTAKIIFYSMDRGERYAPNPGPFNWPPVPIIINKIDDVHVAGIDMCQYIIKGEILRRTKFGYRAFEDDGHYAEYLKNTWPNDILILPEIGIRFNYFEPGRYDKRLDYGI